MKIIKLDDEVRGDHVIPPKMMDKLLGVMSNMMYGKYKFANGKKLKKNHKDYGKPFLVADVGNTINYIVASSGCIIIPSHMDKELVRAAITEACINNDNVSWFFDEPRVHAISYDNYLVTKRQIPLTIKVVVEDVKDPDPNTFYWYIDNICNVRQISTNIRAVSSIVLDMDGVLAKSETKVAEKVTHRDFHIKKHIHMFQPEMEFTTDTGIRHHIFIRLLEVAQKKDSSLHKIQSDRLSKFTHMDTTACKVYEGAHGSDEFSDCRTDVCYYSGVPLYDYYYILRHTNITGVKWYAAHSIFVHYYKLKELKDNGSLDDYKIFKVRHPRTLADVLPTCCRDDNAEYLTQIDNAWNDKNVIPARACFGIPTKMEFVVYTITIQGKPLKIAIPINKTETVITNLLELSVDTIKKHLVVDGDMKFKVLV